jgi:hypothetical protein
MTRVIDPRCLAVVNVADGADVDVGLCAGEGFRETARWRSTIRAGAHVIDVAGSGAERHRSITAEKCSHRAGDATDLNTAASPSVSASASIWVISSAFLGSRLSRLCARVQLHMFMIFHDQIFHDQDMIHSLPFKTHEATLTLCRCGSENIYLFAFFAIRFLKNSNMKSQFFPNFLHFSPGQYQYPQLKTFFHTASSNKFPLFGATCKAGIFSKSYIQNLHLKTLFYAARSHHKSPLFWVACKTSKSPNLKTSKPPIESSKLFLCCKFQ